MTRQKKLAYYSCYLNEPAGLVAKIIVSYAVTQVVAAWSNETIDARSAVESILQCFFHPALLNTSNQLHQTMFATVKLWVDSIPPDKKPRVLDGLTREGVRQGRHHDDEKRKAEVQVNLQMQSAVARSVGVSDVNQNSSTFGVGLSGAGGVSGIVGLAGMATVAGMAGTSSQGGISGMTGISGQGGLSGMAGISGQGSLSGVTNISGSRFGQRETIREPYDYSHNYHLARNV